MTESKTPQQYFYQFKEDIQKKVIQLQFQQEKHHIQELLEFIYEYPTYITEPSTAPSSSSSSSQNKPSSTKKRVKPPLTPENRCMAKLSNGGQCSRQRLKDKQCCGTHNKEQPYGLVSICKQSIAKNSKEQDMISHEVFAVEIQGLVYYVDHHGNVFRTEDVLNDTPNPTIIAKYTKTATGYSIPSLGIFG